ncbi:hypothetical protein RJ641_036393 [Dillenia turbinata]|uniref:Uncharacterized protein n=1 Tax=Dillenia turbinata TaxID=194707 RepID=A0AAN8VKQ8_9MAGN
MKPSFIIFLCLLTMSLCLLCWNVCLTSSSVANSSSSLALVPGRRTPRRLGIPLPEQSQVENHWKTQVNEDIKVQDSEEVKQSNSDEDVDKLIYHIDYHGVMTHPTPTPKHP